MAAFFCFNDAAVCIYISMDDRGLSGQPELKIKEEDTAQTRKAGIYKKYMVCGLK